MKDDAPGVFRLNLCPTYLVSAKVLYRMERCELVMGLWAIAENAQLI